MLRIIIIILAACSATVFLPVSLLGENTAEGRTIFLKYKCNSCHSVKTFKIGPPVDSGKDDQDDWDDEESDKNKSKTPDLSNVGLKYESKGEWLHQYLRKKATTEKKRKHIKRFKGSDEERAALVNWLLSLKASAKNK